MNPYTKTPKWVMAAVKRRQVGDLAGRVLLSIADYTIGYNEPVRQMTIRQIAEDVDSHPNHVGPALRSLIEGGYVVKTDEGLALGSEEFIAEATRNVGQTTRDVATRGVEKNNAKRCKPTTRGVVQTDVKPSEDEASGEPKKNTKKNSKKTPLPPEGDGGFLTFRSAYPKCKRNKEWSVADLAWKKHKLTEADLPRVLAALEEDKASRDWKKESGDYIPLPASWLNKKRWTDAELVAAGPNVIAFPEARPWAKMLTERGKFSHTDAKWIEIQAGRLNHFLQAGIDIKAVQATCESDGLEEACRVMWEAETAALKRREAERVG